MAVRRILLTAVRVSLVMAVLVVAAAPAAAHGRYEVQAGDTLSHIAARHGVTVDALMEENDLGDANRIVIGQALVIPHPTGSAGSVPKPSSTSYEVRAGDTLSEIALAFGVKRRDLMDVNNIADPHRIFVGQRLVIPAGRVEVTRGAGGTTATTARGRYHSLPTTIVDDPARLAMVPSFERWADANGVAPDLLMSIGWQESGWQTGALSSKGAVGVGQLMPETSAWVAADLIGVPELDPQVADDNIRMSARFVRWLLNYLGDEDLAIAAYFQGPGSITQGELLETTEIYVASVQAHRRFFSSE